MPQHIGYVTLVVRDYDEAITYYTNVLGFELVEDTPVDGKRWVLVRPSGGGTCLLLARAANPEQANFIGNQTGGRVFLFLQTDDCLHDYDTMRERGVGFLEQPRRESYGIVAVFEDLYGNKWDLLQLNHHG